MPAPTRHPLARADLQSAFDWYEVEVPCPGAGVREQFRRAYRKPGQHPLLYAIGFSGIRRVNLNRFPFGIFYAVKRDEVRVPGVLHGSRETGKILAKRRRTFFGSPF